MNRSQKVKCISQVVVSHTFDPSTQEEEVGGALGVQGQPGLQKESYDSQGHKVKLSPPHTQSAQWNCVDIHTKYKWSKYFSSRDHQIETSSSYMMSIKTTVTYTIQNESLGVVAHKGKGGGVQH